MKTAQIEKITSSLQSKGYGWISRDDCRKIILIVQSELVLDAVFTPLEHPTNSKPADVLVREAREEWDND